MANFIREKSRKNHWIPLLSLFILLINQFEVMKTQETNATLSKNNYIVIGPAIIRPGGEYDLAVHALKPAGLNLKAQIVVKSFEPSQAPGQDNGPIKVIAEAQGSFKQGQIGNLTIEVPANLVEDFGSRLALRIDATDESGQPLDVPTNGTSNNVTTKKDKGNAKVGNRPRVNIVHPPISLRHEADLLYNGKTKSYLIQTDKAKYKPSDKVQFRIIALDPALKPLTGKVNVYITDAKGNRVKQWKNRDLNTGTYKDELQLADKAVLGTWQITVVDAKSKQQQQQEKSKQQQDSKQEEESKQRENEMESAGPVQNAKSFEVEEYILPTYEIKLSLPPYGLLEKKTVKLTGYFEAKYTFGGYVPGRATITLKDTYGEYVPKLGTVKYEQTELVTESPGSGRTDFEVAINYDDKDNFMEDSFVYGHAYTVIVSFVDTLTLKSSVVSQTVQVYSFPLQLTLQGPPYYKPGLPYALKIEATQVDGRPLSPQDAATYKSVELKKIFSYSKPHYLTNDTFVHELGKQIAVQLDPKTSKAHLTFDDTESNVYRLGFEAQYPDQPRTYTLSANKFEEPSEVYLEVSGGESTQDSKVLKLGSEHTIKVQASIPVEFVSVIFVNRGRIQDIKIVPGGGSKTIEFTFKAGFELAPSFKVVGYVITRAGNIIADSIDFRLDQLTQNTVTLGFQGSVHTNGSQVEIANNSVPVFEPKTQANLAIKTAPGSLVGVLGVDKSVRLLGAGNDLSLETVRAELDSYGSGSRRGPSHWLPWSRAGNSYQIFKDAGLLVLTDADLYVGNEMIYARQYAPVGLAGGPMMDSVPMAYAQASGRALGKQGPAGLNIVTRSEFPETWIWEDAMADAQGKAQITKKVPDTITTWVATAISMNNDSGIGISEDPAELRVFMPFFVALNLPYSVIRGEKVRIQALVYNYLGQDVQAQVQLEPESGTVKSFEILDEFHPIHGNTGDKNLTRFTADAHKVVIKSGQIAPVYFYISPLLVGKIKLKIKAETPTAGDAIEKILPVKAEGSPVYFSKTFLVNLKPGNDSYNQTFLVPWDVGNMVEGSNHLEVSAIGDIMGPSLSSIGNLVRLPYGCGEQNMLNFAPNLYIYSYLRIKDHLTPALKSKIKSYTEQGYQRQLTYQREDGSFSAFGPSDKNGSVWLTAFVLRSFVLASGRGLDLIYVDAKVLKEALDFLLDSQTKPVPTALPKLESPSGGDGMGRAYGDFPEVGEVHHKPMQGGTAKGLALTAFVYIALKETQTLATAKPEDPLLDQRTGRKLNYSLALAESYMADRLASELDTLTPYDLAIVTYALTLARARAGPQTVRARRESPARDTNAGSESLLPQKGQNVTEATTSTQSPGILTMVTERIHEIVSHALHTGLNANEVKTTNNNISNPISQEKLAQLSETALKRLMNLSKTDGNGDLRFWSQALLADSCGATNTESCIKHEPISLDFETTAYALLVLTTLGRVDDGLPILRWLVTHRSSLGGFSSTQDTIVALNALAKFASLLPKVDQDLKLLLAGDLTSHEWSIDESNSFVQNVYSFGSTLEKEISLSAKGSGLALIQVSWSYNLKNLSQASGFNIEAKTRLKNNTLKVDVCLNYAGVGGRSNMAIVEINAPTGYIIDKESLKPENQAALYAKITELTDAGTKLNLYFDSIGSDKECFKVQMEKLYEVQDIKPSLIKVSDYYQPEYQSSASIQVPNDFSLD